MKKAKNDALSMLVLMVFSALFYLYFIPSQVPVVQNSKTFFTSRTFPQITMAALFVVAAIGFGNAVYRILKFKKAESAAPKTKKTKSELWVEFAPYVMFIIVVLYGIAFKFVGFLISSALFIPAFLLTMRCKKWTYYVGSYVFCAIMYLIFTFVLKVNLP